MKFHNIILSIVRAAAYTAFALILFVCGIIAVLYSPWAQNMARVAIVDRLDGREGRPKLTLNELRLHFPLTLEGSGLALEQDGDTLMAAEKLRLSAQLLPLLAGKAYVSEARLQKALYVMGTPDSLMYMRIKADSIGLSPAVVNLTDMAIELPEGGLAGAKISMVMRPDTGAPTPPAPPTKMSIKTGRLHLDDFTFAMRMMPTIDTLTAHIVSSDIDKGLIDLLNQKIKLASFAGTGLDARYIAPDSLAINEGGPYPTAAQPATQASAPPAMPWSIEIDSIAFDKSHGLYTTAGVKPLPGLDFAYIELDELDLRLHKFFNCGTDLSLPLSIRGRERCGISLAVDGTLDIDSTALEFKDVQLSTHNSTMAIFSGTLGMGDLASDPQLPLALDLDGAIAPADLGLMFPALKTYLAAIPRSEDVQLTATASGTTGHLDISRLDLDLNRCIHLGATGYVENFMNPALLGGNITLKGSIINVDSFKNALLSKSTAATIQIPPMKLNGNVAIAGGTYNGRLTAITGNGDLRFSGRWNGDAEKYTADLKTNAFPVNAFLPSLGVGAVTTGIDIDGKGYDPFSKSTYIEAKADISSLLYNGTDYKNITADLTLSDGMAKVKAESSNTDADFTISAQGNLDGNTYSWTADIDGRNIDLYALKFSDFPSSVEIMATGSATVGPGKNDLKADIHVADFYLRRESGTIGLNDINVNFLAGDSLTTADITNGDLRASFQSFASLDSLTNSFSRASTLIAEQLGSLTINVDTLGKTLPPFAFTASGGRANMVNDILTPSDMSVREFYLSANNGSFLTLSGAARGVETGSMTLDSLYLSAIQDDADMHLDAGLLNRPGNLDQWHSVNLKGSVKGRSASLNIHQQNIAGNTGFSFGLEATSSADSSIVVNIRPYAPVIGYKNWTVNDDNFIRYDLHDKHLDANVRMNGDNSSLAIYTQHDQSLGELADKHQEDLIIQLKDIHIADWISFNPFAPPMKGDINADMRINLDGDIITGKGSAGISGFMYDRQKVADINADFDIAASQSGTVNAKADLMVNGIKTMTLNGALNDSTLTSPMSLDFAMIHFPLNTVNPFLPRGTASLSGTLNGNLKISGSTERPVFDGTLDFDSTAVNLTLTGTHYQFSDMPIDVENSIVQFNNFSIKGCNDNPLFVNGTVDISDISDMRLNLGLKARNMMLVNSNRAARGADVYGKAYIDLDAMARGSMNFMQVNAKLTLLSSTNVTYVIPDATSIISNQSTDDMVKFVNFSDSLAVAKADSIQPRGMAMNLDAVLTIDNGSIINVDLSADGKNRAQIQSNGTLTYAMSPLDDGRLSGRLNIDKGFVRYTPPFMSEKNFTFDNSSYVAFNGDMMNPTLNIHATDVIKANVTQSGQNSRLVNFDVTLSLTGSLSQMNAAFDLATNDDMTVANELESMSPEQRANQAMNMLLYNVYTGPGTKGNASLSGNPLFSFLESQLNQWASNTIKGVDISFGIDQYDRTYNGNTSSTMSYSYQVSKSLFNDRFKIVVGGNYSTDANADENFSQNLINDISFEYFLNNQRTMYVRLFRHTGYESILEGEITQTGVGFVYRRKLRRLGDMFMLPSAIRRRDAEPDHNDKEPENKTEKANDIR